MNKATAPSRREFLVTLGGAAATLALPASALASMKPLGKPVRIGMIADLHHDIMHDGEKRLTAFLDAMGQAKPDAIVQLGDFAYPDRKNKAVIDKFNQAHERRLHVIGNHDTDSGHTQQQCLDVWGMRGRYYSQDVMGLRFLVLDGNDKGSPTYRGGYASYIGKEQQEWLKQELESHDGPVVILSHQPLNGPAAVDNAEEIQALLKPHGDKLPISINGHTHIDSISHVGQTAYLHINSASYVWMGGQYKHDSYSKDIHEKFPWISHTCPYENSLFTLLTFDCEAGVIEMTGRKTQWVGKSPSELRTDSEGDPKREYRVPEIKARKIQRD